MGRIYEPTGSRFDPPNIAIVPAVPNLTNGHAASREEAMAKFRAEWEKAKSRFLMTHHIYGPWWAWAALAIAGRDADGHRRGPIGALVRFVGRIQNNSGPPQGPASIFRGSLRLR